ncbi:MAG: YcaO-related McrA-glycine thioamidation protein [Methanobacterium sp.]|uniref:YcaO-related McrA-glycine thioamidation protein n=1 Tax=Methanobacterium sp. TaxID=2164 RepID=UPI003D65DAC8|nr:YcaO-related McrA-glycine thioamidation protein [Methanobacterium sp.]
MFKEVPVKYFGCTHRAVAPEETIRRVEGKLKAAGVTRVTEITHLDRVGIPVYSAIRPSAAEGAVSIYAGKGATKDQAKASAMMEAFERYSAELQDEDHKKIIKACFDEIEGCVNPKSLILPNLPFDPDIKELKWVNAVDVETDKEYLTPADAVFHPYGAINDINLFKSNTNGLASGNKIEEAIFHGMMEVIERDAWSLFEIKRKKAPEINLETIENPIILEIIDKFKEASIDIKIVDLTSDVKATTIAAVSDDTILKDPALLTLGVGTHLDPEIAVMRALTEVAQSRATQIHGTREDTTRAVFMRKAGYERMKRMNKHWFGESEELIDLEDIKNSSGKSFKEDIEISLKLLKKAGFKDVLFVDLTRVEVEVPVVRVIIPGMEVYSVDPERVGNRLAKKT